MAKKKNKDIRDVIPRAPMKNILPYRTPKVLKKPKGKK